MSTSRSRSTSVVTVIIACSLWTAACAGSDADGSEGDAPDASDVRDTSDTAVTATDGDDAAVATAPSTDDLGIASVRIEPSAYSPIAAQANIESDTPTRVSIVATSDDHVVEVPITAEASTAHEIPVVGLRAERDYDLEIDILAEDGSTMTFDETFTTGAIPGDIPELQLEVDVDRRQPGITLIEPGRWNAPEDYDDVQPVIGIDDDGEVVWYYANTSSVGAMQPTPWGTFLSYYFPVGLRETDLLGNVLHNYQVSPDLEESDEYEARQADVGGAVPAVFTGNDGDPDPIILDADWVELTSIHHEAAPMPNGNILALSTTIHELTPEQRTAMCPDDTVSFAAVSDVVIEFTPDGTIERSWDLWDVLDIDAIPGSEMCTSVGLFSGEELRDWTHANSVVYDELRDAIVISSRHTDQVIALDHLDETGPQSSLRWIIGAQGTIPLDGDLPYHQHAAEVHDDGSIVIYDNGNGRPGTEVGDPDNPTYSRAVMYDVDDTSDDPSDWTATQRWEYRTDEPDGRPIYARFVGDADLLPNGDVLITHGGIDNPDEPAHVRIVEVITEGPDAGDVVWDLSFGDADKEYTSYRAERLPSLYFGPQWETSSP